MSTTQTTNSAPTSGQKKSADIKCVQTTKGWVCALCFPLGHSSRALERVMNLAELKSHAAGNHYASLGQNEWDNYVKKSVYFEAQFRNQSSLGLNNGVMHGPPTLASQKSSPNKAGVLKRTYVKNTNTTVADSAFDLMESMINFNPIANNNGMIEAPTSSADNQDEDSETSDIESAPTTSQAGTGYFLGSFTADQSSMHSMDTQQTNSSQYPLQSGINPSYDQFSAQNHFGMHSMNTPQVTATPNTIQNGNGPCYSSTTTNYDMHLMDPFTFGASPATPFSKIGSSSDPYAHLRFDVAPEDESQIVVSPNTPSRKKTATPKNPLRQRLSENPSFESAVSVHGLAKVQAAGNVGLQRYLDRQARGLPRTSNTPLQLAPTPRYSTMDLPLTAANYAAAGMPNIHIEKATRRTKKIDRRRRQGSTSLGIADATGDNTFPLTNTATTNTSLNIFGVPAAIFGQAPGAAYKSHTYKSIYAENSPKEKLPLAELSLPDLSFADQSLNNIVLNDICESFDFDAYMADPNCTFGNGPALENTAPQQNTGSFDDFFIWAGIPNQNTVPLNDTGKIDADFFAASGIANTHDSDIEAMLGHDNSSSQHNNHNFTIFKATSFEYGPAGLQALKDAEATISARSSLSGASSNASSSTISSPSSAGSTASSIITEPSSPVTHTLSGAVAPDMAAILQSMQELEATNKALTQELAFQKGLHQADVRHRNIEAKKAIQRREDEAWLKKKANARQKRLKDQRRTNEVLTKQLAVQKETNDTLRKLLVQEKTSRKEDKQRHNTEFKAQTELVVKANAVISRQTSEIDMLTKQIRQKKTVVAAATTIRAPVAMRAPVIEKPTIDRRKLLAAKKPTVSIQAPGKRVSAYDQGRKTTHPSNVAAAINPTLTSSSRKRAAPETPAIATREHLIKKARTNIAGDAKRKLVPDGKGGFYWTNKFDNSKNLSAEEKKEAEEKHNREWLRIMNEHTDNKVPGNSLGIQGHLPNPNRFDDRGRF